MQHEIGKQSLDTSMHEHISLSLMVGEHGGSNLKAWKRKARELKNSVEIEKPQDANKCKFSQTSLNSFSRDETKKGRMSQEQNSTDLAVAVVQLHHTP